MGVDRGRNLLALGLPWSLQDGVADAEGEGEVGHGTPGILNVVFEFVGLEVTVEGRAIIEQGTRTCIINMVVIDLCERRDGANEVSVSDEVRILKSAVDGIKSYG
jgi:hypothetical protein